MKRQAVTLLVGEYRTTRIVEQIASLYSVVLHNPDNLWNRIDERNRSFTHTLSEQQPMVHWLWVFDFSNLAEEHCRVLLANGTWWLIDILLLDPTWTFSFSLYGSTRWINHVLRFPLSDGSMLFPTTLKRDPFPTENLGTVPFGSCVRHRFKHQNGTTLGYNSSVWRPWQKAWAPEQHLLYPVSVRQRVRFLLLAQLDAGSLLGRLDKACLLEILRSGAALDSESE